MKLSLVLCLVFLSPNAFAKVIPMNNVTEIVAPQASSPDSYLPPIYSTDEFWKAFDKDPSEAMNKIPTKFNVRGEEVAIEPLFTPEQIASGEFVTIKDQTKSLIKQKSDQNWTAIDTVNDYRNFFPSGANVYTQLDDMERAGLNGGSVSPAPWSGDYWPLYKGGIGARYAAPNYPKASASWPSFYNFWENTYSPNGARTQAMLDNLSPSEKYDMLVQDPKLTLTRTVWGKGVSYYRANGLVEKWVGICHGWSAAAVAYDRPAHVVQIRDARRGVTLKFYPDDIKALASLLWANTPAQYRYLGSRCNVRNPARDSSGHIVSPSCFDTNPASWHIAITNQLGAHRTSFILDATYDYEVWNQPAVSYRYSYFNPRTRKNTSSLNDATVRVGSFNDIFRKHRSPGAQYVVGINMTLTYTMEKVPNHNVNDSAKTDILKNVQYLYDLELDGSGNIIGGEWYQTAHPDMLWKAAEGEHAFSISDASLTSEWNGNGPMPSDFVSAAPQASSQSQPLARVVDALVNMSR